MTYRELAELLLNMSNEELEKKVVVYCEDYNYHYPCDEFVVTQDENGNAFPIIVLE